MTQAQLDFHNMTFQVTQEQIDLQNHLEMHTADLAAKPLSNDSPVLFLDTNETSDDLKTDKNDPSFLSTAQKANHHLTYTRFLQQPKPQNYIFANYKYTSLFTMTNLYTIDHSK